MRNDRYPAPEDAEFTFTLKLDGKLAASRRIRVFVKKEMKYSIRQAKRFLKTSRSGDFTLKDGQTACFERWERVFLMTTGLSKDNFIQISPPNGSPATGTTTMEGAAQ